MHCSIAVCECNAPEWSHGGLNGAPAVDFNFPLQSFSLYINFKREISASDERIPLEKGRFGECTGSDLLNWLAQYFMIEKGGNPHSLQPTTL